jgi:predicted chitinase
MTYTQKGWHWKPRISKKITPKTIYARIIIWKKDQEHEDECDEHEKPSLKVATTIWETNQKNEENYNEYKVRVVLVTMVHLTIHILGLGKALEWWVI